MNRPLLLVLLFLACHTVIAAQRELSITIDDLPWVEYADSTRGDVELRHRHLLQALHGTHAVGFVNEDKLYADGELQTWRLTMLRDWLDAGLDLGNHTYGHVGLNKVALPDYERAILDGEKLLRPLLREFDRSLVWFRHPFLQTGREDAVRIALADFLAQHAYRAAPVTIDNGDWIFARAYLKALNAHEDRVARRVRALFVDYMLAKTVYFERQAQTLLGRPIPQVLLLHASALNSDALPALLDRLRRRGYAFVPLATAVGDPAYARKDGYYGGGGISWLHRWAMAESRPKTFYRGEPVVPKSIMDMAGVTSE